MGIVKYSEDRRFNIGQAFEDGFGIEWAGEDAITGLKLQDRKNPDHKAEIVKTDWFAGTFRVFYKNGGWQCFDHCVEQFELERQ